MKNREFEEKVEAVVKWAFEQGYKAALEEIKKNLEKEE